MNNKNYGFFYHRNNCANVFSAITFSRRKVKSSSPLLNSEPSYHLSS